MATIAKGSPTKEFFVEMLTRDIELNDAILDLLDNCLDGVVRSCPERKKLEDDQYYRSYCAEINISKDSFTRQESIISLSTRFFGHPKDIIPTLYIFHL